MLEESFYFPVLLSIFKFVAYNFVCINCIDHIQGWKIKDVSTFPFFDVNYWKEVSTALHYAFQTELNSRLLCSICSYLRILYRVLQKNLNTFSTESRNFWNRIFKCIMLLSNDYLIIFNILIYLFFSVIILIFINQKSFFFFQYSEYVRKFFKMYAWRMIFIFDLNLFNFFKYK